MIWGAHPYFWKHPYNVIYIYMYIFLIQGILLPAYNEAILRIPIGQPSFCFMMSSCPSSLISGSPNWIQVFLGLPIWFFQIPWGLPPKKMRAGDCERALFSPCSHLSSVMVQNSHTCEGDMMKENNIRTSEANRKTS